MKYPAIKLYECILQSYLFCGFPAAIESFKIFRKYYEKLNIPESDYDLSGFKKAGQRNCKLIYKKNYKKLIENMNSYSPDLKEWMIIEGYGKVMGRKGLTLPEREFINVSILYTRFYENQLYSHLKGSIYLGSTKEQLNTLLNNLESNKKAAKLLKAKDLISKL